MWPTIRYKGGLYKIVSLWFDDEYGKISHASFMYLGSLITVFPDDVTLKKVLYGRNHNDKYN
jgi:hypothetical protein